MTYQQKSGRAATTTTGTGNFSVNFEAFFETQGLEDKKIPAIILPKFREPHIKREALRNQFPKPVVLKNEGMDKYNHEESMRMKFTLTLNLS